MALALDFGPDAAKSADVALDSRGDQDGYHLLVGQEKSGFAWREVAVLRPAGRDESSWTGYQCLSGDGEYAAVAILPVSGANSEAARDHGGFAYSVDLASGKVHPIAKGVGVKYYSPGCGTGDDAIFTLYVGAADEDTRLLRADLSTGKVTSAVTVDGQVTSSVPVQRQIVGVRGGNLVSVVGGKATAVATVSGSAYDLRPTADGVAYLQVAAGSTTATAVHYRAGRTTRLGEGPLTRLQLFPGRAGHPLLSGATGAVDTASGVRVISDQPLKNGATAASLDGHALLGADAGETLVTRTGKVVRTAEPDASTTRTTTVTAYSAAAAAAATQTPTCAVPRLDPARQAMQPNAAQVNLREGLKMFCGN